MDMKSSFFFAFVCVLLVVVVVVLVMMVMMVMTGDGCDERNVLLKKCLLKWCAQYCC